MQNEPDYAAALQHVKTGIIHPSNCEDCEVTRETIKRALLIAEKMMREPSEWLKDSFSAYCFKGFRAKLIEEIDHAEG